METERIEMDETDINFNSDSTYCSTYEHLRKPQERKRRTPKRQNHSKFLDKVHNDVVLHLEGKKLIGRIQILHYINKISKMTLAHLRDKYYAEKINYSLLKLLKITGQFERSFSQLSVASDPVSIAEQCTTNQDFKMVNNEIADDPKQMLLQCSGGNNESSFPLELLTNDNFVSPDSENFKSPLIHCANYMKEKIIPETKNDNNIEDNSKDIFSAENNITDTGNNLGTLKEQMIFTKPSLLEREKILNTDNHVNSTAASSFPLELLTNDNFVSSTPKMFESPTSNCKNQLQKKLVEETLNNNMEVNSTDLFSSECSEVYIEDNLETSNGHGYSIKSSYKCKNISDMKKVVHPCKKMFLSKKDTLHIDNENLIQSSKRSSQHDDTKQSEENILIHDSCSRANPARNTLAYSRHNKDHVFKEPSTLKGTKSNKINFEDISNVISGSEVELSQLSYDHLQQKSNTEFSSDASTESEFNDVMLRILNIGENQAINHNSNANREICITFSDQNRVSLQSVMQLGNLFNEAYYKKTNKLCYGIGKESEKRVKWQEIQDDLEQCKHLAKNVCCSLDDLFKKLSLEDLENKQIEYKEKLDKCFHNFDKEEKLDLASLMKKNEVKLEKIFNEMRVFLISEGSFEDDNMDIEDLDWRKLLH